MMMQSSPITGWGSDPQASLPRRLLRAMKLWKKPAGLGKTVSECDSQQQSALAAMTHGNSLEQSSQWGSVEVILEKHRGESSSLGISLSGGGENGLCPRVSSVRPNSAAHDLISVGDYVSAVNGVRTERLRSEHVQALLQSAQSVSLELQYELPPPSPSDEGGDRSQRKFDEQGRRTRHQSNLARDRHSSTSGGSSTTTLTGDTSEVQSIVEPPQRPPKPPTQRPPKPPTQRPPKPPTQRPPKPPTQRAPRPPAPEPPVLPRRSPHHAAVYTGAVPKTHMQAPKRRQTVPERVDLIPRHHTREGRRVSVTLEHVLEQEFWTHVVEKQPKKKIKFRVSQVSEGCSKVVQVSLQRDEDSSLGFTIRGGSQNDPDRSRPLLVTQVREGGPADRSGCIRPGDRLIAIDGISMLGASLREAHDAIRRDASSSALIRLSIEVDVAPRALHMERGGPLLIEVSRAGGDPALGLALTAAVGGAVIIAAVRPGSVADRCGALQSGDQILAVGNTRVEKGLGPMECAQLIAQCGGTVRIETLPHNTWGSIESGLTRGAYSPRLGSASSYASSCGRSTLTSQRGGRSRKHADSHSHSAFQDPGCGCRGVSHCETVRVTLLPDTRGYGFTLEGECPPTVAAVEPGSPADVCGCLQPGDRVLEINRVPCEGFTGPEAMLLVNDGAPSMSILVQFEVAETVVPASGVFTVKLARRGTADLGIFLSTPKLNLKSTPVISEIRRGSVAHRSGALLPGDQLLEVGGTRLVGNEEASKILLGAARQEVVVLKVLKGSRQENDESSSVTYSVELTRLGGPLGLTISGTQEPFKPIYISALTPGGLAERTGALHIGDRLLSIDGHSLHGSCLSDAIEWLQTSGDRVTLEISRPVPAPGHCGDTLDSKGRRGHQSEGQLVRLAPANPSVDSAVESWSSGVDHAPGSPGTSNEGNAESATVKRRPKVTPQWDSESHLSSADSGQSGGSAQNMQEASGWDVAQIVSGSTGGSTEEGDEEGEEVFTVSPPRCGTLPSRRGGSSTPSCLPDVYQVTLYKDRVYEDFGFSVSDGLYERGVYINRIRRGGPADLSGKLRPYDRILQVNETRTLDFDCCLTVPLIAAAGDSIELTVARNPFALFSTDLVKEDTGLLPWLIEEVEETPRTQATLTKTL